MQTNKLLSIKERRKKNAIFDRLRNNVLVVKEKIGGIRDGLLDDKSDSLPDWTADSRQSEVNTNSEQYEPSITFRIEPVEISLDGEIRENPNFDANSNSWIRAVTLETKFDGNGRPVEGLQFWKWSVETNNEDSRTFLKYEQTLEEHSKQVSEEVERMVRKLNFPEDEIDTFVKAAKHHDDGKAVETWQRAMNAPTDGRVWAKTRGGGNLRLLNGYRHEFGSYLAIENGEIQILDSDLFLHLVAAHHGNARPILSISGCDVLPPSVLEAKAKDIALRFAKLQEKYGHWGLAWREAILRAADQNASRKSMEVLKSK